MEEGKEFSPTLLPTPFVSSSPQVSADLPRKIRSNPFLGPPNRGWWHVRREEHEGKKEDRRRVASSTRRGFFFSRGEGETTQSPSAKERACEEGSYIKLNNNALFPFSPPLSPLSSSPPSPPPTPLNPLPDLPPDIFVSPTIQAHLPIEPMIHSFNHPQPNLNPTLLQPILHKLRLLE